MDITKSLVSIWEAKKKVAFLPSAADLPSNDESGPWSVRQSVSERFGAVAKATLGNLLRDRVEHIRYHLELNWTAVFISLLYNCIYFIQGPCLRCGGGWGAGGGWGRLAGTVGTFQFSAVFSALYVWSFILFADTFGWFHFFPAADCSRMPANWRCWRRTTTSWTPCPRQCRTPSLRSCIWSTTKSGRSLPNSSSRPAGESRTWSAVVKSGHSLPENFTQGIGKSCITASSMNCAWSCIVKSARSLSPGELHPGQQVSQIALSWSCRPAGKSGRTAS